VTRLLVLGGTRHVGRAAVGHALARGWDVTVVNRGLGHAEPAGVQAVRADRTVSGELATRLSGLGDWDIALDTWSAGPDVVRESASLLAGRVTTYGYVSSVSVYQWPWPMGVDETAAVVDAEPDEPDYASDKRGSEIAVLDAFGEERSIIARAGLILGPYEVVGRLPWWLRRIHAGGSVLAPGPSDRPIQFIDGRDLAAWLLDAAARGIHGTYNAVGPAGVMTMGQLLQAAVDVTGSSARLDWIEPEQVEQSGFAPWTQLPIWAPPDGELAAIHAIDATRATATGLVMRPPARTIADTWQWLLAEGYPASVLEGSIGFDEHTERDARGRLALAGQPNG
jgi:2'-hydroxyisoflavone reductase